MVVKQCPDEGAVLVERQVIDTLPNELPPHVAPKIPFHVRDIERPRSHAVIRQMTADRSNRLRATEVTDQRHKAIGRLYSLSAR